MPHEAVDAAPALLGAPRDAEALLDGFDLAGPASPDPIARMTGRETSGNVGLHPEASHMPTEGNAVPPGYPLRGDQRHSYRDPGRGTAIAYSVIAFAPTGG